MTHWAKNDRRTATGSLKDFPRMISDIGVDSKIKITSKKGKLVEGNFYAFYGQVDDVQADICLVEQKAVLE